MPKGSRAVQLNRGHISISRATADDLGLCCAVTPVSLLLELTVAQAVELGQGLLEYASEAHHPDACASCGRVNAKSPGCQCGEYETVWGVWVEFGNEQGDELLSAWETEEEAEREQERLEEASERAAPGHYHHYVQSFDQPVLPEKADVA